MEVETEDRGVLAYPVPIRSMTGDGNIGGGSIDHVVSIGVDSIVHTLEHGLACHLEDCLQLRCKGVVVDEGGCCRVEEGN